MNNCIRAMAIGMVFSALVACGPRPVSTTAMVEFDAATAEEKRVAATILEARCRSLVGSQSSQVTATVVGDGVRLEIRGEAPPDEALRLNAGTQGVMRIASPDSPPISIVTDKDVESATPQQGASGPMLDLVLSERAGQRMLDYTKTHGGGILATTWDGVEVTRAQITGPFGRRFEMTGLEQPAAMLRAVVLRNGRLPKPVLAVVIHHPAR